MKILSFGEILWDVYPDKKYIGGAPLNFAAHSAKHGESVYMLSTLGDDDLGKEAREQLKKWNVSDKFVSVLSDKPTGQCIVSLDDNRVPFYNLLNNTAYDHISCDGVDEEFDVLYFGTLALRSEYNYNSLKKLIKTGHFNTIFADINIRPPFYSKETVEFSVKNAAVLKVSLEELPVVAELLGIQSTDYKGFSKTLSCRYDSLKCIIITLGSDGAYALDCKTCDEFSCGCADVKVVSTVGAGDSFSAAFLSKYLRKNGIQQCLEYASVVAGYTVSQYDAVPDYNAEDFDQS